EIKVSALLDDVKKYLKNAGNNWVQWDMINISDLGYRLVVKGQNQYLGARVAGWDVKLKPQKDHVDDIITVKTPIEKPGAYLLTAKEEYGNMSRILVGQPDRAIVKKQLEGKASFYAAAAIPGKPIPKANVEYFGYRHVYDKNGVRPRVETTNFAKNSDADG